MVELSSKNHFLAWLRIEQSAQSLLMQPQIQAALLRLVQCHQGLTVTRQLL